MLRRGASPRQPGVPGWQLLRPLGSGARTTIYLARPAGCPDDTPPDYAVKILRLPHERDAEAIAALRREAMVGRQVSHPHVISVLTARVDQPPYYVVMPRLDGVSLRAVLRHTGHIACNRVLWLVRKVAEGLDALHQRGWLHGDVKPDNVMATVEGHVTLIDLGFARPLRPARPADERPLMGTLQYAAPECFVSSRSEDQRSDIYSLGITLYELLTHRLPFEAKDPRRLVLAHREQNPRNPRQLVPQLPHSVARLLQSMLAKDPLRRPQTAGELVSHLARLEIETFGLELGG